MKTLSRYVLFEFLKPLFFTILTFVGLYIISQLVDEMRTFVNHKPSVVLIILYYFYRIPYITVQIMPLSILLAALFSLGQLARHNELIALRGCGISFFRVVSPILTISFVLVVVVMIFNEVVIPYTNPRAIHIKRVSIENKQDNPISLQRDWITRSVSGNRILHAKHLDAAIGYMEDITLLNFSNQIQLTSRIDAPRARWQQGTWTFEAGVVRRFNQNSQLIAYQPFERFAVQFKEHPREFIRQKKRDIQLLSTPIKELNHQIRLLKEIGIDPKNEEVNFHLKIAFPFANFILALLGVSLPFIFPTGRRSLVWTAIGFVITIITGFFYIGFIAVGTSFGKNGTLSPILSVWMANIVFGLIGLGLMIKARN